MKWILITTALLLGNILPTQAVSYEEKQAYFKKLLSIQQKLQQKVQSLRKINDQTLLNVKSLKGQPDLQKTILESGVQIQRQQLQSAFKQTLIPLKDNYWTCKDLSNSEKDLIAAKIKDLKSKTESINNQLKDQKDCVRNTQLKSQLKFLTLHIQSLQNQLSNTCQPPRKDSKLTNNLKTPNNWIYGNTTPKDYQKQLDYLKDKYELVQCPKETPFVINSQCGKCEKEGQIFSVSENKCIDKCNDGTIFLKVNHECRDPKKKEVIPQDLSGVDSAKNPYVWGPITQQQYKDRIKQLKDNNIPIEQCPAQKPFPQNGQSCTTCPSGQVFNVGTKQCTSCKDQQKYVDKTHQCKQVYKKPNYDAGKNWVTDNGSSKPVDDKLKDLQSQNYPVEQCPSDKPFPSKDLKECKACDKKYDLIKGTCEDCNKYFIVKDGDHQCTYVTGDCKKDSYWNGQKCLKCINGKYDNNYRECKCPVYQKYDQQSGQCLPFSQTHSNPNPTSAQNFIGSAPAPSKFLNNCPADKPFFDLPTQQCISCPLPQKYYNYKTNKCQVCDKNLEFNVQKKECVQPVLVFNSNLGPDANNYCCGEPTTVQGKETCPENRPFFDGYHCVACVNPRYFDFKDKQCKDCPQGKAFSTAKKECVDEKLLWVKVVSNIPSGVDNFNGNVPNDKPDIQGQQVTKCPTQKPFSNGKECLSCELPRYFNFQSNQCQLCQQGYSFSTQSKQCQRNTLIGKEFSNTNMINADNFVGKVPEYKKGYPECPSDKRYFNGAECQKCELPKYWNFDKNDCKECDKNQYFDKVARQCVFNDGEQKFRTNVGAINTIYYNGDIEQLKKEISQSSKPDCPSDKPFFDKSTNDCITCNGNVFNFVKNHCMTCPDGTYFNEEYHICFQNGVKPTIERMAMNSLSWI